jgi:hypothetical protein
MLIASKNSSISKLFTDSSGLFIPKKVDGYGRIYDGVKWKGKEKKRR